MLADCGCRLAEFCAWQVKLAPSCSALAVKRRVETELNRFPSAISSCTADVPSVMTVLDSSSHVIWNGMRLAVR